ncbi:hypothetical protein ACFOKI_02875 [Sphingomonas qilianensis]|uniref:Internal virion protein B n=1 Tax=Sphingomonas qilianensis TaxID=1736690 RepID=A0ABU9XVI4_9SPHN
MCDPITLTAAAATAVTMAGQVSKGVGDSRIARYEASVADQNARLASEQARDSIENTNIEALRVGRQHAQTKGQAVATMAGNGVDLNFGSAVDVQRDNAMTAAEDMSQIYKGGNERTKGFEISAFNYKSSAAASRAKAKAAKMQGFFNAASTALGSASQISSMRRPTASQSNAYGVSGSDGIY